MAATLSIQTARLLSRNTMTAVPRIWQSMVPIGATIGRRRGPALLVLHQQRNYSQPEIMNPRDHATHKTKPAREVNYGRKRFADFDLMGKVFIVTGGAQGLGLALAEALCEAGGKGSWHVSQPRITRN